MSLQTGGTWPSSVIKWSLNSRLIIRACASDGSPVYTYAPNHLIDHAIPGGTATYAGPVPTRCGPIDRTNREIIERKRFNGRLAPLIRGVHKRLQVEWVVLDSVVAGDPDATYYRSSLETVLSYGDHERNYFQVRLYPGPWRDCWLLEHESKVLGDRNVGVRVRAVFEQLDLSAGLPGFGDTQPYGTMDWQGW